MEQSEQGHCRGPETFRCAQGLGATGSRSARTPLHRRQAGPIMPAPVVDQRKPSRGTSYVSPVSRRPRRQPPPPAAAAPGTRRLRSGNDRRGRAARDRGRRDSGGREDAGGRRAPGRDRRRAPPRLVAHGLHLPARRRHEGGRLGPGAVPQRARATSSSSRPRSTSMGSSACRRRSSETTSPS